jgi:hypothetical protein
MTTLQAKNKSTSLVGTKGYAKIGGLLLISFAACLLVFWLTREISFLPTLTIVICAVTSFLLAALPPKTFDVSWDTDTLVLDGQKMEWAKVTFWALVDLEETIEFILQVNSLAGQTVYFYVDKNEAEIKDLIATLTQNVPYKELLAAQNPVHSVLRNWGFK